MIKIGLTGGIASGKSTVSKMISQLNIPVIDADQISRDVVEPGMKAYQDIVSHFGKHILLEDGKIDRKALGSIIFPNEAERDVLNQIVHPEVRRTMFQSIAQHEEDGASAVVLDIPLLIESKLMEMVDKILLVYVDQDVQLSRLTSRDKSSNKEASARIGSQIPLVDKKPFADEIIDNNGTQTETREQLLNIFGRWHIL